MLIVAVALHVQDLLSKFFEREACYNIQQEFICIGFARTQNCFQNKSSFFKVAVSLKCWNRKNKRKLQFA